MKGSKDFFLELREQEIQTDKFLPSKKEVQKMSLKFAKEVIDSGQYNLHEVLSLLIRQSEAFNTILNEIKQELPQENFESFGLKGTFKNGGDMPQFTDDIVYADLKNQLKERENLLKTALKSDKCIYDEEGAEVPKISTKPRKSSIQILF